MNTRNCQITLYKNFLSNTYQINHFKIYIQRVQAGQGSACAECLESHVGVVTGLRLQFLAGI